MSVTVIVLSLGLFGIVVGVPYWFAREEQEMSNPTRDGRAMIAAGMLHPDGAPKTGAGAPAPNVTIGAVHVSNRQLSSPGRYPGNERGVCLISHFGT